MAPVSLLEAPDELFRHLALAPRQGLAAGKSGDATFDTE